MAKLIEIFPTPLHYQEIGGFFTFTDTFSIHWYKRFNTEKEGLIKTGETLLGKKIITISAGNGISLNYKEGLPDQVYDLEINAMGIIIRATGTVSMFYGLPSLKTMIPPQVWAGNQISIQIPTVIVKDQPHFDYRAFMLDVG